MAEAALDLVTDSAEEVPAQDTVQTQTDPVTPVATDTVPEQPVAPSFPDDWREQLAGGDEKLLNELKRFTSPQMLVKSWKDTRTKISSGKYKTALPDDPSEEELAAWRAENGVPESWEQYDRDLGDGMILGEEDAPIVDNFLKAMHERNLPASVAKDVLRWYYEFNDGIQQEQYERDVQFKESAIEDLRSEWGAEYKANLNAIRGLVGDEIGSLLFGARAEDGTRLGDHPAVLKFLAQTARELNPAATIIPGAGTNSLDSIADEMKRMEAMMGNPASAYWKDEKMQERYRTLLTARDRLKG